jgi:hypothetical protein
MSPKRTSSPIGSNTPFLCVPLRPLRLGGLLRLVHRRGAEDAEVRRVF